LTPGELSDPVSEFMVFSDKSVGFTSEYWDKKYTLRNAPTLTLDQQMECDRTGYMPPCDIPEFSVIYDIVD
ncbi:hypothetical protein KIPB_015945, partial [Kipferlia bialata]